jgi:hypothetical protein
MPITAEATEVSSEYDSGIVLGFWQREEPPTSDLFDELRTGLDHIAFGASNRGQIEAWIDHFTSHGVEYSEPIEFGPLRQGAQVS